MPSLTHVDVSVIRHQPRYSEGISVIICSVEVGFVSGQLIGFTLATGDLAVLSVHPLELLGHRANSRIFVF